MSVEAVIFDWGGTLTPWRTVDLRGGWRAVSAELDPERAEEIADALHAAEDEMWRRCREEHRSGTVEEVYALAGVTANEAALAAHVAHWEPHTLIDPDVPELLAGLRRRGLRLGVLSNTLWSRAEHERIFARDAVLDLFDGAVYTSEIPWTKPHPEAFRAAMRAVGVSDPGRCVFVGDRLFDDVYGARRAGMRTVHVPHSEIPPDQRGHTEGEPDAVVQRLAEVLDVVDRWR